MGKWKNNSCVEWCCSYSFKMSERKFKKNLGTLEDVTKRHTESKRKETKEQRNAKLQKKRMDPIALTNLPDMIRSLTLDISSLPLLNKILSADSERYYGPCEMFPEFKGPYLFETDRPLLWLASLLNNNSDPSTLQLVTSCFVNISAHSKQLFWVSKIVPFLPALYDLLEYHPDPRTRENIIYILSNMCTDNVRTRDLITEGPVARIMCKNIEGGNWPIIGAAAAFLKGIFIHREEVSRQIVPLWNVMIDQILITHFPAEELVHNVNILLDILLSLFNLTRYSDDYKKIIISNKPLMSRLCDYCRHESQASSLSSQILSILADCHEIHPALVNGGMIQMYTYMLNVPNPIIKIQGSTALASLAESVESFPLIASPQVLNAVRMQFEYVDVSPVLEQLYYLITSIVLTAAKNNLEAEVYPFMLPFICRISDGLVLLGQNNLVAQSILALKHMLIWDKQSVLDQMEDSEALSRLDRLAIHGNPFIHRESTQLMEWIESGTEFMEE